MPIAKRLAVNNKIGFTTGHFPVFLYIIGHENCPQLSAVKAGSDFIPPRSYR
jgi:hypothetical protein